ncbi:MarR family transcriptional regulator [Ochrobactrum sp. CM-21-5]|nr:MarR family transcriptional regulator [Ochrobactrum sp. CM-21-5]MBC2886550.1 MarR family transcriptional regulator [Ochrobactrum sp. CM-21-5]
MPSCRYNPDTFGFLVTDISRLYRAEIDRHIVDAGLEFTPAEARTLVHVARHAPVRQAVLAERMGIEAMTLSGHLDRLEGAGMIQRIPDPNDRRAKQVHLTDAAEKALETIHRISSDIRAVVAQSVAPVDWERLNTILKDIRNDLVAKTRS